MYFGTGTGNPPFSYACDKLPEHREERKVNMLETQKTKLAFLCGSVLLCGAMAWFGGARTLPGAENQGKPDIVRTGSAVGERQGGGMRDTGARAVQVTVCVSGAVQQPGLYTVAKGTRAQEVIVQAGGYTADADPDRVNLAKPCKDGTHIRVPRLSQRRLQELRQMQKAAPEGRLHG